MRHRKETRAYDYGDYFSSSCEKVLGNLKRAEIFSFFKILPKAP